MKERTQSLVRIEENLISELIPCIESGIEVLIDGIEKRKTPNECDFTT